MKKMLFAKNVGEPCEEFLGSEEEFLFIDKFYCKEWLLNGNRHREGGPAVIWKNGSQKWYQNGLLHRDDGPALIHPDGRQEWWANGKRHREDGPARIWPNGIKSWWLNGIKVSEKTFL